MILGEIDDVIKYSFTHRAIRVVLLSIGFYNQCCAQSASLCTSEQHDFATSPVGLCQIDAKRDRLSEAKPKPGYLRCCQMREKAMLALNKFAGALLPLSQQRRGVHVTMAQRINIG